MPPDRMLKPVRPTDRFSRALSSCSPAHGPAVRDPAVWSSAGWPSDPSDSGAGTLGTGRYVRWMPRTDIAERWIDAPPERVHRAFVDADALLRWLPPTGMHGRFEHFDPQAGGSYRMVLTYESADGAPGKSTEDSDIVEARFLEITPGRRVVQSVEFVSDDPAMSGTMTMVWTVTAHGEGAMVEFRADGVPDGISAEDHAAGMASSLENLAAHLQR